jgi:outer membrane biosynthesis protein TonB
MEKKKTNLVVWSAGSIVVLVAAFGLGMVIRQIREWRAEVEQQQPDKPALKQSESKLQQEAEPLVEVIQEPTVESAEPAEQMQHKPEKTAPKDSNEAPKSEPVQERPSMAGGMGNWWQMWADLNLTEEEMARLREGFRLARERWQNMSEEQRQAEMDRLSAMRERWENMSDEERQAAMERGRQRFEEWRRSDRVELPEMNLD